MKITPKSLPFSINKRVRPVVLFFGGLMVVTLLLQIPFLSKIRESIQYAATTVGTGVGNVWSRVFQSNESVYRERAMYQTMAAEFALKIAQTESLASRVNELETLLGYRRSVGHAMTSARIIARSPDNGQTLLIDKGTADGISNNMPVVAEGGHLIGSVLEARDKTSLVRLLADTTSSVPATILGDTRTIGLVQGEDGFLLHMQFIPQDEAIAIHDVVVSSGLDAYTPPDLVIGIVSEVIRNEAAPFQSARIEPLVDLRHVTQVFVITGTEDL